MKIYQTLWNNSSTIEVNVQRKLGWVKNSSSCWVLAWDCGAGHYFFVLFYVLLGFAIFPFPVSTAQFIDEFWKNTWSGMSDVVYKKTQLTLLALHFTLPLQVKHIALATPLGDMGQICCVNKEFSRIFFVRCTLPIRRVKIAAPIVLAQYKEHQRIGGAQKRIAALPLL
jgi:hypothetical protein